jgi:hypothetical protein
MAENIPPLYRKSLADDVSEQRFEGDLYGRRGLAEKLTGFLSRCPDGAVLAIDSPWGEGKTWFAKRWRATLDDAGYRTGYIDCFQRDYLDDPFVMIAGEIIEIAKKGHSPTKMKLIEAGKKLGVALVPAATKAVLNVAGHWALGKADFADNVAKIGESIEKSAAANLEKLVEKRLEAFVADGKTVQGFKSRLAELAAEDGEGRPIVIFLDELDRCRPDFAVRTIERLKHFFDAPKVIFVLMVNKRQLVAATEGLYGQRVDAEAYLGKFIQLSLSLPKRRSFAFSDADDNRGHCKATMDRYGFTFGKHIEDFSNAMGTLGTLFGMSLRDIERAVALYSFAHPVGRAEDLVAWPIALKLSRPDIFAGVLADDRESHRLASSIASTFAEKASDFSRIFLVFKELHRLGENGFANALPRDQIAIVDRIETGMAGKPHKFLVKLFGRFDLSVSG